MKTEAEIGMRELQTKKSHVLHTTMGGKEKARKDSSLRPAERDERADTLILDLIASKTV